MVLLPEDIIAVENDTLIAAVFILPLQIPKNKYFKVLKKKNLKFITYM
jgi:hypothetical protein